MFAVFQQLPPESKKIVFDQLPPQQAASAESIALSAPSMDEAAVVAIAEAVTALKDTKDLTAMDPA